MSSPCELSPLLQKDQKSGFQIEHNKSIPRCLKGYTLLSVKVNFLQLHWVYLAMFSVCL